MGDYEISERNDGKKIFAFIAQEEDDYVFITKNNLLRHDNIKLGFNIFYYLTK